MIYVDPLCKHGWKLYGKYVKSCHLFTDGNIKELHEFAKKIGLKLVWFQMKSTPHYDLIESKRNEAIKQGAIEICFFKAVEIWKKNRQASSKIK